MSDCAAKALQAGPRVLSRSFVPHASAVPCSFVPRASFVHTVCAAFLSTHVCGLCSLRLLCSHMRASRFARLFSSHPTNISVLRSWLPHIVWRSTRSSSLVRSQAAQPKQTTSVTLVKLNPIERAFYDASRKAARSDLLAVLEAQKKQRSPDAAMKSLITKFKRFCMACNHPSVGNQGIKKRSKKKKEEKGPTYVDLDEAQEHLLKTARTEAEECLRFVLGYVRERSEWRQVETRNASHSSRDEPFIYSKRPKSGSNRAKSGPNRSSRSLNALRAVHSGATRSQIAHSGGPRSQQRGLAALARK